MIGNMVLLKGFFFSCCTLPFSKAFSPWPYVSGRTPSKMMVASTQLYEPAERDVRYGNPLNTAQYLVDLHDSKAAFDFCGGMMFQLVLSEKLRDHLKTVIQDEHFERQPVIFDASRTRMSDIPDHKRDAYADNIRLFHGREIRKVDNASGGMGFVLQLSLANENDSEGWTEQEVQGYDGWGADSGRVWRKGDRLEEEGFDSFMKTFGSSAYALHHRFYLHFDRNERLWLSAEDGCEGTPARPFSNPFSKLFGVGR